MSFSYTPQELKRRETQKAKGKKVNELSTLERRFEKAWDKIFPEIEWTRQAKPLPAIVLPGRKKKTSMKFDYQCGLILVECQGAVWGRIIKYQGSPYVKMSGHNSPEGITDDHLRANHAAKNGYRLMYISEKLLNEQTIHQIAQTIEIYGGGS